MKNTCLFMMLGCILSSGVFAAEVLISADASCRTEITNAEVNRHDSSKLSIRSDASSAKSWIKFDQLGAVDLSSLRGAKLRVALHEAKAGSQHFDISAVNDDYTTNIGWLEREITWNNAPANDTTSYAGLLSGAATFAGTVNFTDGTAGQQFEVDVLSILQADTDGIVQFVLHNSSGLMNCATHDHSGGAEYWPTLILTFPPPGADYPDPAIGETVPPTLSQLSWINPDPNDGISPIRCDVYLGTEPNLLSMDMKALTPGEASVAITTDNFPNHGVLSNNTLYYWLVDCHDPSNEAGLIPGEMWTFLVGQAPTVDAGPDQSVWLDPNTVTVNLNGTTSDDGSYTVLWTQESNGAPNVTISPNTVDDTSVTLTERGDYVFRLTANDGILENFDTVRIVVGDDACDASHLQTGSAYNPADINQDCLVDLLDFVTLIADDWLGCTDTLTLCGQL